ncbi:MAG: hypothetical protein HN683_19625 [Gammaproteobacteria bacterium]|jgi:hypothetical protein|nr:hypothetical protein [Gammaproteobacteria bacterium]
MAEETSDDIIRNALTQYGLEGLLNDTDLDLIGLWQRTADFGAVWAKVQLSDSYKARFPAMEALASAGRAISEETYVALERQYAGTLSMYGMPSTFYDAPDDFGALIAGDVSPQEFSQRVGLAAEVAVATTPEVKEQLERYYGITTEDLTAYYLDPERATNIFEERERFGTARIGGIAVETGAGAIDLQTAERLQAAGVTETTARQGFQAVAASTLAEETASEEEDITTGEIISGEFGLDIEARRKTEERRQRRQAAFAQTGGPAMTAAGFTGLGSAQ